MKRLARAVLTAGVLTASACTEEARGEGQILLALSTNLEPDTEIDYVTVEVLTDRGNEVYGDAAVVRVAGPCRGPGRFQIGSLTIAQGRSDVVRLRARGYRVEGERQLVVERRVDARFEPGRVRKLEVLLERACVGRVCGERTCDPATGECGPVPLLARLQPAPPASEAAGCGMLEPDGLSKPHGDILDAGSLPQTDMDASSPPNEGGAHHAPLDGGEPADAAPMEGDAAGEGWDAGEGGKPRGVGADLCETTEASCCSAGLHDLRTCGSCQAACADIHVELSCGTSACAAQCESGYKDCNPDLRGCETNVRTAENCGDCGNVCAYGYCGATGCEWKPSGNSSPQTTRLIAAGEANGFYLFLQHPVVRALGALVDPELPGHEIRIAIYKENGFGLAEGLVLQTDALRTHDNPDSGIPPESGMLRVEAPVRATRLEPNKGYWIFVQASQSTRFAAQAQAREHIVYQGPFAEFAGSLPAYSYVQRTPPSVYAITTPE